jgi:hypothetical protein
MPCVHASTIWHNCFSVIPIHHLLAVHSCSSPSYRFYYQDTFKLMCSSRFRQACSVLPFIFFLSVTFITFCLSLGPVVKAGQITVADTSFIPCHCSVHVFATAVHDACACTNVTACATFFFIRNRSIVPSFSSRSSSCTWYSCHQHHGHHSALLAEKQRR